jgi:Ca-activated chloride channel homolog
MKKAFTLPSVVALLVSAALCSSAQNGMQSAAPIAQTGQSGQPKPGSSSQFTFRMDAEEVVLNCTVVNNKGELVNDLTAGNFKILEDKIPQTVISLQHQDTPVSIGMVIDNSGSMSSKRAAVASAALDLVKASNPQDETFVINFSDQAYLDQDFTSDLDKLQNGLAHLSLTGSTALYDTLVTAAEKMQRSATRPRKVLIVITDGDDNASKLTLKNAIHSVQDMQGPIIYSIGLLFAGDKSRHARHDLEALSNETGGIAFFPTSLQEIDSVAAQVARDIRNQYAVAYHSKETSVEGYHAVKIEARSPKHGKLTVYSRSCYLVKVSSSRNPSTKTN